MGYGLHVFGVFRRRQGEGLSLASGASCASDTVYVVLRVGRDVVVEDMGNVGHIEAAGGHVAGYQKGNSVVAEVIQGFGAQVLVHVAVELRGGHAVIAQVLDQGGDVTLAVTENNGLRHVLAADQGAQSGAFAARRYRGHEMGNGHGRGSGGVDADFLRIHQEHIGEPADFRGHGSRKEQGLADLR